MVDEPLERKPKRYTAHLSSTAEPSGTTDFLISTTANHWLPAIISLVGGLLFGAMSGMASWINVVADQKGYAVAFAVTGVVCSFLPLGLVQLILHWMDAPLRRVAEQDSSTPKRKCV